MKLKKNTLTREIIKNNKTNEKLKWKQIRINLKQVLHQSKSLDLNISSTHIHSVHTDECRPHARNAMQRPNDKRIDTSNIVVHCSWWCCWLLVVMRVWKSLYNSFMALFTTLARLPRFGSTWACSVFAEFFVPLSFSWWLLHHTVFTWAIYTQNIQRRQCWKHWKKVHLVLEASVSLLCVTLQLRRS